MKGFSRVFLSFLATIALALPALANPVPGTYTSTDLGGQLFTGRGSTWRTGINSGFPHVVHAQSWSGAALGTQWDVSCPSANAYTTVQDNRVNGTGTVVYTTQYSGGTFTFLAGGWPWGDGTGTLNTTVEITTVQHVNVGGNSVPFASVVNSNTEGTFSNGCALVFAIANGNGVGETSSLAPSSTKPADYPVFLDGTCGPAAANAQFGAWGNVSTITMHIQCPTPSQETTWGGLKSIYR